MDIQPIGILHSPYREKFIVPRQPGLVNSVRAELELLPPCNQTETIRELEQFSHLWLIFQFHQTMKQGWQPTVRPPRLGGNKKVGVFASRSPFRPNPIGLSVVELIAIRQGNKGPLLEVQGIDLVDATPILDIKPYIPYTDAVTGATAGFAERAPATKMAVRFSEHALAQLAIHHAQYPQLQRQITELLACDPRPAYQRGKQDSREYGALLYDLNIRWQVLGDTTEVIAIDPASLTAKHRPPV